MNIKVIPGATYGEYWPSGAGLTSLTLPSGHELLHFRVSQDGRIIGQGHADGKAWYWTGIEWMDLGETAGTSIGAFHPSNGNVYVSAGAGVRIYNAAGTLIGSIAGYLGSNGIRQVLDDGEVISGDASYNYQGHLGEFTVLGNVRVGQGLHGGLDAWVDGHLKHLADGQCMFPRINRVGDQFAAYFTDFQKGYLVTGSLADILALPDVNPVQPPVPVPVPTPAPIEVPHMPIAPNQLTTVKAVFAAHPEINAMVDGERGQLTTLVVQALGGFPWGRKEKQKGTGNLSDDALTFSVGQDSFEIYDTQRGFNPGDARVPNVEVAQWTYAGTFKNGENGWFYTVPTSSQPPVQPPVVIPPTPSTSDHQLIVNLQGRLQELQAMLNDSLASQGGLIEDLTNQVKGLAAQVTALVQPKSRTIRTTQAGVGFLRHSHEVTI